MRELIRRILKERRDTPEWYEEWEKLPLKQRIAAFEDRKKKILKKIPLMVKFFEEKYGNDLDHISVLSTNRHFASEDYSMEIPLMTMYFNEVTNGTKSDVLAVIIKQFKIDLHFYGIPFDIEFYRKLWDRF